MSQTTWDIHPGKGCGDLAFGMSPVQVSQHLGPAVTSQTFSNGQTCHSWETGPFADGYFEADRLVILSANLTSNGLTFDGESFLHLPVLDLVNDWGRKNGGLYQAQGGSLYFDNLHMALLQFENPYVRELLFSEQGFDHHEPLREVTLAELTEYYLDDEGKPDPSDDSLAAPFSWPE